MNFESFQAFVVGFLAESDPSRAGAIDKIGPDEDLLGSGLVDSQRFIELCLAVEDKFGTAIDIAELDPDQFSTISGLYEVVARTAA